MAKSFTVPCPSCEADVLVKNEGMIGKKIDCPKCKYRFKVPDPNAVEAGDEAAADEVATPKKKKGNSKVLIGAGVGVGALVLLGVVGFLMFSGDDKPKQQPMAQRPITPPGPTPPVTPEPGGTTDPMPPMPGGTTDPMSPMPMGDPNTQVIAPPMIAPPGTIPGGQGPAVPPVDTPKPVAAGKMKDPTNLLPGQTQAVLQLNMQKLQPTPFYAAFFDRQMLDFFRNSMSFDATDISHLYIATVGAERDPFAVIRTKSPVPSLNAMAEKMEVVAGKQSPIKGVYQYGIIKTNPFVTAIGRALSSESLLGSAGIPVTDEDKSRWKDKPLAICVYDSQTVLIGEVNWMEGFLTQLNDDGYPAFQTELTAPAPVEPPAAPGGPGGMPMPASPMAGGMPMPASPTAGGMPVPMSPIPGGPMPMPMGPGGPMPMGPGDPAGGAKPAKAPPKLYTSVPTYRTVKPELKRMLNLLEEDDKNPPAIVYADMLDKRLLARDYQSVYAQAGLIVSALVEHTQMIGLSVTNFQKDKCTAQLLFEFVSAEDAKNTVNDRLVSLLKVLAPLVGKPLGTTIEVRNMAGGQNNPNGPGGEGGIGMPPGSGGIGMPPGSLATPGSSPDGGATLPGSGSPGGMIPGGMNPTGRPPGPQPSKIELGVRDTLVTVDAEINWSSDAYQKAVQPVVAAAATQLKGRMAVLSGAAKQGDLATPLKRLMDEKQMAPPATFARNASIDRYGLPYPPDHRVSFLADLLPYLGKGGLRQSIEEKKYSWYAKEHEAAAGTWVSEFLVPDYPQIAWRATHPLAEGRSLGGTNYVAVSGLGLDSARYDPANPEFAKKVGMVGYEWGSKPADVTDGLSNTMYMIQVPPTHARPWIAGGGSTVQGIDDTLPNPIEDFVHNNAGNKRGTHVLMGDGSVRFVPEGIDAKVFKAMATRAGGESLGTLDKDAPLIGGPKGGGELKGNVPGPVAPKKDEPKKDDTKKDSATEADLDKLQGKWKFKKAYSGKSGKEMPAELVSVMQIQIVGNRIIASASGKEITTGELTLDATKKPKTMLIKTVSLALPIPDAKVGEEDFNVYELDADKLVIRGAGKGAKEYPKEVKMPEAGSKDDYNELERSKD